MYRCLSNIYRSHSLKRTNLLLDTPQASLKRSVFYRIFDWTWTFRCHLFKKLLLLGSEGCTCVPCNVRWYLVTSETDEPSLGCPRTSFIRSIFHRTSANATKTISLAGCTSPDVTCDKSQFSFHRIYYTFLPFSHVICAQFF